MPNPDLQRRAKILLNRRVKPWGVWDYIRHQRWLRSLMIVVVICGVAAWLYQHGQETLGVVVASVLAGRLLRDLVWFRSLSKEWRYSNEFIDWPKVEKIAAGEEAEMSGESPLSPSSMS